MYLIRVYIIVDLKKIIYDTSIIIFFNFKKNLFLAASSLSCSTPDLRLGMQDLSLQRTGFYLVVA